MCTLDLCCIAQIFLVADFSHISISAHQNFLYPLISLSAHPSYFPSITPTSEVLSLSEVSSLLTLLSSVTLFEFKVIAQFGWYPAGAFQYSIGTFKTIYSHQFLIFSSLSIIVMLRNVKRTHLSLHLFSLLFSLNFLLFPQAQFISLSIIYCSLCLSAKQYSIRFMCISGNSRGLTGSAWACVCA